MSLTLTKTETPLKFLKPTPDALDSALLRSEKRIQEGNLEISANLLKFGATFGQNFGELRREENALQKELMVKKKHIELLSILSREKRSAHVESARTSMTMIAKNITSFLQIFRNFKTGFPKDTLSQISESEIPNNEWLTRMQALVTEQLEKYPFPEAPPLHQTTFVATGTSLVLATHNSQVAQVVETTLSLQENVRNMKGELQVLEENIVKLQGELRILDEREQEIRRYEIQAIKSWNEAFSSYAKQALLFQEKVRSFLQQQNASLVSLNQESNTLRMMFINNPNVPLLNYPNGIQMVQRELQLPFEIAETLSKIDKTPPLLKQIDIIVPLMVGIMFKQPEEGKS